MKTLPRLALAALCWLPSACNSADSGPATGAVLPWVIQDTGWRSDAAWYDGKAEKSVYAAARSIYGVERNYLALAYTNKQAMDPRSTTKSADGTGIEVFKHHWSERIETENYDYDYSTASFTTSDRFQPFKLTVGTQEDCGTSFKQVWREANRLRSFESVYFPDAGMRSGQLEREDIVFEDALPLVLRDFPFGQADAHELWVVPSQKSTKRVPFAPELRRVVARGEERLELPIGELLSQRLDLMDASGSELLASYWFASDGSAPLLHVLVRYQGAGGESYALQSHVRTAYWER